MSTSLGRSAKTIYRAVRRASFFACTSRACTHTHRLGSVYALDFTGITAPNVTVWTVWHGDSIAGIGALKHLGDRSGELKSMRTHPDFLRRGVASALLEHIIGVARRRGMVRLSLETGSGPYFEPALLLYRRRGFVDGPEFAGYERTSFNQFLHMSL